MAPIEPLDFEKPYAWQYPREYIPIPQTMPCSQKVLIITDGFPGMFVNGSFHHYYFGLSAVIDTLLDQTDYYVKFKLTLAHRQTDSHKPPGPVSDPQYQRYGPNFENFRFTTTDNDIKTDQPFDIYDYDQIWLFGVRDLLDDPDRLDDDELALLTDWMEKGGGLFATGDHARLGVGLCGRVPRVSKMRLWTEIYKENGDLLKAPPPARGASRHDTLVKGHDSTYTFDDESDDVPMRIAPKYYYARTLNPLIQNKFPHPILCGKDGVIDILPDHPHEGDVIEDDEVDVSGTLYNGELEFPKIGPYTHKPEVIAHARVQHDHTDTSDTNKGAADAKTFGAIGVYDGYKTNVGRAVVDSTWHHWFNVNLVGRPVGNLDSEPSSASNPKTLGFLATPEGIAEYKRIQNYHINVGLWLAPKSDRYCMIKGLVWPYVLQFPFVERLEPDIPVTVLGAEAKDALGKIAGQCNLKFTLFELLPEEVWNYFEKINLLPPDQCLTCPPEDLLQIYILGTMTSNLLELAYMIQDYPPGDERVEHIVKKELDLRIKSALKDGLNLMIADLDRNMSLTRRRIRKLKKMMDSGKSDQTTK